jgi:hypothetical protein
MGEKRKEKKRKEKRDKCRTRGKCLGVQALFNHFGT